MNLEELRNICLAMPHVTEDIKWENHLCFCIGEKIFIITSPESVPVTASFKVSDENFDRLITQPGFSPAQYLARYKWVSVDDLARLAPKKWKDLMQEAYDLVAAKLPGKIKAQLGMGVTVTPQAGKEKPKKVSKKKKSDASPRKKNSPKREPRSK